MPMMLIFGIGNNVLKVKGGREEAQEGPHSTAGAFGIVSLLKPLNQLVLAQDIENKLCDFLPKFTYY